MGDIEKMFRQINIAPEDRDMQRIVWRSKPEDEISEYQLNTVTYGTASATYLAVRTLQQLAQDDGHLHPLAKEILMRDFYMDDLLSGAESVETALLIQTQITTLLARGGQLTEFFNAWDIFPLDIPPQIAKSRLKPRADRFWRTTGVYPVLFAGIRRTSKY